MYTCPMDSDVVKDAPGKCPKCGLDLVPMDSLKHEGHVSQPRLAFEATLHCLTGCGIGDIVGVIIGTAIGISYYQRIGLGLALGFVFGFSLGVLPLIRARMTLKDAARVVLTTEFFSIVAMEAAEALIEISFPGMRRLGLMHIQYWIALTMALTAGFVVAYPVNLFLVKRGIRHHH